MNIRRGMFRVWVVASIAWATTVGVVIIPDVVPKQAQQTKGIPDEGLTYEEAFYHVPPEEVRKSSEPVGLTWEQYTKQKQIEETWRAMVWTAAPPLGLLIAWFTGAWIARGFRGDDGNV
jgi:hypothetical protein